MARILKLYAPSGLSQVSVDLIPQNADTISQNVPMTEKTAGKGIYTGTLAAAAGTYDAVVWADNKTTHVGAFGYVRVEFVDPETVPIGDAHGVPDGFKLRKEIQRNNVSGDSLTETIDET